MEDVSYFWNHMHQMAEANINAFSGDQETCNSAALRIYDFSDPHDECQTTSNVAVSAGMVQRDWLDNSYDSRGLGL